MRHKFSSPPRGMSWVTLNELLFIIVNIKFSSKKNFIYLENI
jgi:hypothetical protein